MNVDAANHRGGIALALACVAIMAGLSILPAVKLLPEAASFWSLWLLLGLSIVFAFIAIFVGSAAFRSSHSASALVGFALGMLVYGLVLGYGVVLWFIYR